MKKNIILLAILSVSFISMTHTNRQVSQEIIDNIYKKRENLVHVRLQMDCWHERIDGKIEAYDEIIQYLEEHKEVNPS